MHDRRDNSAPSAAGLRIAVVTSRYHSSVTSRLRAGAIECFRQAGGDERDLELIDAPGTFELTVICRELATDCGRCDAIVALGCVITGETVHDRYICEAVSRGLTQLTIDTGVPMTFGVLTCQNHEQAEARAGGAKGNKGAEAMSAAIECASILHELRSASGARRAKTT